MSSSENQVETLEQKFVFSLTGRAQLVEWLDFVSEPDPRFAQGVIHTLYFDTPDLKLYEQKRASEYLKFKVRLRWYGDARDVEPGRTIRAYLEVKRKIGATRRKERTAIEINASVLTGDIFEDSAISALAGHAVENGFPVYMPLVPMALIRYRRRRFIEPATGARGALDWDISCVAANRAFLSAEPPAFLEKGVLEIKGPYRHLPRALDPVAFLLHKSSFSKYAQCLENLMNPLSLRI